MRENQFKQTDTYTAAGNGISVDTREFGSKHFSISVKGTTAAATAWNVVLEGSFDNTNFDTILTHTDATGNGKILFSGAQHYPIRFFRSRCVSITLGSATNIVCRIIGSQ